MGDVASTRVRQQAVHSLMRHRVVPRIPGSSAFLFGLANVPIMYAAFFDPSLLDPVRISVVLLDYTTQECAAVPSPAAAPSLCDLFTRLCEL